MLDRFAAQRGEVLDRLFFRRFPTLPILRVAIFLLDFWMSWLILVFFPVSWGLGVEKGLRVVLLYVRRWMGTWTRTASPGFTYFLVLRLSMPDDIAAAAAIGLLDGLDIYTRRQHARAVGVIGWTSDEERYFDYFNFDRYISHASPLLPPLHCRATLLLNPRRLFS